MGRLSGWTVPRERITRPRHMATNVSSKQGLASEEHPDPVTRLSVGLEGILQRHAVSLRDHRPRSFVNHSGYQLFDLQCGDSIDLGKVGGR